MASFSDMGCLTLTLILRHLMMYAMIDSLGFGCVYAKSASPTWLVVVANLFMKWDAIWSHERMLPGSRKQYQSKAGPIRLLENCQQRKASSLAESLHWTMYWLICIVGLGSFVPSPENLVNKGMEYVGGYLGISKARGYSFPTRYWGMLGVISIARICWLIISWISSMVILGGDTCLFSLPNGL